MDNPENNTNENLPEFESIEQIFEEYNPLSVLGQQLDADIFVVTGSIQRSLADNVVNRLQTITDKRANCIVYLCTFGGDPDAAYIIARAFQNHYESFSVYISGYCKSAGTLIVLGADEIAMGAKGELGALDVQLPRDDVLTDYLSGLDIATSISKIGEEAYGVFERTFLTIINGSGGSITTKTAADIAVQLSTGIVSPLVEQFDVFKFVESVRSMDIAMHYGIRLGANSDLVNYLAVAYPSHSFVIDFQEASNLFPNVRLYNELDIFAEMQVQSILSNMVNHECIRLPHEHSLMVLLDVDTNTKQNTDSDTITNQESKGDNENDGDTELQNVEGDE